MAETYYDELIANGVPESLPKDDFMFEDMFDEFVASTQKTWVQDRALSVGASEAFGCARKTWFSKRGKEFGYEKDASYQESWGAIRRGDLVENYHVVPAVEQGLRRRGMDIIMHGEGQETIIDGIHSATLDGLIINCQRDVLKAYGVPDIGSEEFVFEVKSFDPRLTIAEEKGIHRGQTQMQMGLVRETTDYRPNYAVIFYVNASWLDDMRIFIVPYDHEVYLAGRQRNEQIFAADDPATVHAEGKLTGMCAYCPYLESCKEVSVARVPSARKALNKKEVDAQDQALVNELDVLVMEVAKLKSREKKIKAELETANEAVRVKLIEANESRAVGDSWKVSYTTIAGRKTLSKQKMEDAGLDPEDFMEQGAGYEKLTVTAEYDG